MDNKISFSKIVATPTLNSWSQAYNAGKLFAVLSLEKTAESSQDIASLNILGKNLLERLEQEFFVIEEKNLESIKTGISNTFQDKAEGINYSFASGAFVNNVLYLFGTGSGKAFIKRGDKLGLALDSENSASKDIASSSGFLKEGDLIILATDAFSKVVTNAELNSSLNDAEPAEIAESLAPIIHKAENGKISAIVIKYGKPLIGEAAIGEENVANELKEIEQSEEQMKKAISPFGKHFVLLKSKLAGWRRKPNVKTLLTKKLFLILSIVIVMILAFSVFFAIRQQNNAKVRTLFAEIYPQASKKYDEGQSLVDLNKNLARDSFLSAQKILNDNKDKFPAKSKEIIQTEDLLKKIDEGLTQVSPLDKSGLDRSKLSIIVANGSGIEGTAGKAGTILKDLGYNVASTGNADNFNYSGVTIKVKKENSKFLDLLKKDLSKEYTIKLTSSDLPPDSPTDCLIIIGK